jgi:ribosome-associated protein
MNKRSFMIRAEEIHFDFIRASGPGGQNVNKVATAVQLRFNPGDSRSIRPEILERLRRLAGKRMSSSGEIIIEARRFRTQRRNRDDAMQRLLNLIEKASTPPTVRHKSRPPATSKLRRLDEKRRRAEIKKFRRRASVDE